MSILTSINQSLQWRWNLLAKRLFLGLPAAARKFVFKKAIYQQYIKQYSPQPYKLTDVYLELRTFCNSNCPFCIASRDPRPDQTISMDLYRKIIQDLVDMNFSGTLHYYQTNDPLVVPNFHTYLAYAKSRLPAARHFVLTNGKALGVKNGRAILEAGANIFSINVYSDHPVLVIPKNVQRFLDEVLFDIYPRDSNIVPIQDTKDLFSFKTHDFSLYIRRRKLNTVLSSRVGTAPNNTSIASEESFLGFCVQPFFQLTITADGRVGRCCNDALIPCPMGNVQNQSIQEIWNGSAYQRLRKDLLNNNRNLDEFCRKCNSAGLHSWRPRNYKERFFKELVDDNDA